MRIYKVWCPSCATPTEIEAVVPASDFRCSKCTAWLSDDPDYRTRAVKFVKRSASITTSRKLALRFLVRGELPSAWQQYRRYRTWVKLVDACYYYKERLYSDMYDPTFAGEEDQTYLEDELRRVDQFLVGLGAE